MKNNIEQIKIIFFDVDDTLYLKDKKYFPESTKKALRKLVENRYQVVICTGRARCSLPDELLDFINELKLTSIITINGQHVIYNNQLINHNPLPNEIIEDLIKFSKSNNIPIAQVADSEVSVSFITKKLNEALIPIKSKFSIGNDTYKKESVYQLLSFIEENQENILLPILDKYDLKSIRWHPFSVDIIPKNASKKRGIEAMLKHLNLKPENAMAFGDQINDIEMIKYVGVGVAMGNAKDQLKQIADYITDDIEQDGIYNALKHFKLI